MPDPLGKGAFVGEHGSWNRDFFNGYKVVYIPFANGEPASLPQDVVTDFIEGDKAYGRPVAVAGKRRCRMHGGAAAPAHRVRIKTH